MVSRVVQEAKKAVTAEAVSAVLCMLCISNPTPSSPGNTYSTCPVSTFDLFLASKF